jgi:predicted DsbA family dithiol-disulfide isomerase
MPNFGYYCSARFRSQGVLSSFSFEDEEALTSLRSKSVSFSLVDLSSCSFENRLKAKMRGINRTPTLVLDGGTKIEGIAKIKKWLENLSQPSSQKP